MCGSRRSAVATAKLKLGFTELHSPDRRLREFAPMSHPRNLAQADQSGLTIVVSQIPSMSTSNRTSNVSRLMPDLGRKAARENRLSVRWPGRG